MSALITTVRVSFQHTKAALFTPLSKTWASPNLPTSKTQALPGAHGPCIASLAHHSDFASSFLLQHPSALMLASLLPFQRTVDCLLQVLCTALPSSCRACPTNRPFTSFTARCGCSSKHAMTGSPTQNPFPPHSCIPCSLFCLRALHSDYH